MLTLIKKPILENDYLKKNPKVLVLQHCRGNAEIDRDPEDEESEDEDDYKMDGAIDEISHRMVCHTSHIFIDFLYSQQIREKNY